MISDSCSSLLVLPIVCPYRRWVIWRAKPIWGMLFMSSWTGWRRSNLSWSKRSGRQPSKRWPWNITPPWESCTAPSWMVSFYTLHMMEHMFYGTQLNMEVWVPDLDPNLGFMGKPRPWFKQVFIESNWKCKWKHSHLRIKLSISKRCQ